MVLFERTVATGVWLSPRALAACEWVLLYFSVGKMHNETAATLPVPQTLTTRLGFH